MLNKDFIGIKTIYSTDKNSCARLLLNLSLPVYKRVHHAHATGSVNREVIELCVLAALRIYNKDPLRKTYLDSQYFDIDEIIAAIQESNELDVVKKAEQQKK